MSRTSDQVSRHREGGCPLLGVKDVAGALNVQYYAPLMQRNTKEAASTPIDHVPGFLLAAPVFKCHKDPSTSPEPANSVFLVEVIIFSVPRVLKAAETRRELCVHSLTCLRKD